MEWRTGGEQCRQNADEADVQVAVIHGDGSCAGENGRYVIVAVLLPETQPVSQWCKVCNGGLGVAEGSKNTGRHAGHFLSKEYSEIEFWQVVVFVRPQVCQVIGESMVDTPPQFLEKTE